MQIRFIVFSLSLANLVNANAFAGVYSIQCAVRAYESDRVDLNPLMSANKSTRSDFKDGRLLVEMKGRTTDGPEDRSVILYYSNDAGANLGKIQIELITSSDGEKKSLAIRYADDEHGILSRTLSPLQVDRLISSRGDFSLISDHLLYSVECRQIAFSKALRNPPQGRQFVSYGSGPAKDVFENLSIDSELVIPADSSIPEPLPGSTSDLIYRENDQYWCEKTLPAGTPDPGSGSDAHQYRCIEKSTG